MTKSEFEATPPEVRQFQLSTVLGLTGLAAVVFSVARYLKLGEFAGSYARNFRESPGHFAVDAAFYVLAVWWTTRFFRRQIIEAELATPADGAFIGTICGGSVFGMSLCVSGACGFHPLGFLPGLALFGVIGAGCAAIAAAIPRAFIEPFKACWNSPSKCALIGAGVGAVSGYVACSVLLLISPRAFFIAGVVPAAFGTVFAARGAYIQAVTRGRRLQFRREVLERLGDPVDLADQEGGVRSRSGL
jgi:hypothetical protein